MSTPTDADAWRAAARVLREEVIAPAASEIDRTDRLPEGLIRRLAETGFLGLGLPEEYGGRGGGARAVAGALEELAEGSAAVATMVAVHLSVAAAPIARWGTPDQKEIYLRPLATGKRLGAFALTEAGAGSDAARIACRYRSDGNGFRLHGTKMFITDADLAGVILAFATRDPALGREGISAFVVTPETPGFSVAQRLPKLGLHGSTTTEVVFEDAELPRAALLGAEGSGFRVAMEALAGGRIGIAACALGTARAALGALRGSVVESGSDAARSELARAHVTVESAAALLREAAEASDAGRAFVPLASAAKLACSRAAVEIAGRGVELAGMAAARSGSIWERLWRDARVFPIVEGTTEIQELILGRELLRGSAATETA